MLHTPVLVKEVLDALQPERGGVFVDATTGTGGHSQAILQRGTKETRLICLDQDNCSLTEAKHKLAAFSGRVFFLNGNFRFLADLLREANTGPVDGILYDLGLSSYLLTEGQRGFSFQADEPLDMRYNPSEGITAAELLASVSEEQLADILYHYGEIRESRFLARKIKEAQTEQPVLTSGRLSELGRRFLRRRGRTNPATRLFQALRIAVNDELNNLVVALENLPGLLKPGGRAAVISYHSLEDRQVKRFFRNTPALKPINKKVIKPARPEILANPASRSAKLRAAEKIG